MATYSVTLVAFFVIVVPSGALWGDISGPFWIWVTVLLAFAALQNGLDKLAMAPRKPWGPLVCVRTTILGMPEGDLPA